MRLGSNGPINIGLEVTWAMWRGSQSQQHLSRQLLHVFPPALPHIVYPPASPSATTTPAAVGTPMHAIAEELKELAYFKAVRRALRQGDVGRACALLAVLPLLLGDGFATTDGFGLGMHPAEERALAELAALLDCAGLGDMAAAQLRCCPLGVGANRQARCNAVPGTSLVMAGGARIQYTGGCAPCSSFPHAPRGPPPARPAKCWRELCPTSPVLITLRSPPPPDPTGGGAAAVREAFFKLSLLADEGIKMERAMLPDIRLLALILGEQTRRYGIADSRVALLRYSPQLGL